MWMLFLAAAAAAQTPCAVQAVQTQVWLDDAAFERRVDRWLFEADRAQPSCRLVTLPVSSGATRPQVRARLARVDRRPKWLPDDRIRDGLGTVTQPGPVEVHVPELRMGDRLLVEVSQPVDARQFVWSPGAQGAVQQATLEIVGPGRLAARVWQEGRPAAADLDWSNGRSRGWSREGLPASSGATGTGWHWLVSAEGLADLDADEILRAALPVTHPPADPALSGHTVVDAVHRVHLQVRDPGLPLQDPRSGRSLVTVQRTERLGAPGTGDRVIPWPEDAITPWCKGQGAPGAVEAAVRADGCVLRLRGAPGSEVALSWGWTLPGLLAAGEHRFRERWPVELSHLVVSGEGVEIEAHHSSIVSQSPDGPGLRLSVGALAAWQPEDLDPVRYPMADWRVVRVGERPVLAQRLDVLSEVAARALAASLPEPGVPIEFRGPRNDPAQAAGLLAALRRRMVSGAIPGLGPLAPRKLVRARRQGWGSPWEMALVLTRYLNQRKLASVPVPVRPMADGAVHPANPVGYREAAVLGEYDSEPVWFDPSCRVCAPGELRPELWGGQALSPGLMVLPPAQPGRRVRRGTLEQTGDTWSGRISVRLQGHEALALRLALVSIAVDERPGAIPALVDLAGGKLVAHEGLAELGAPVSLEIEMEGLEGPALPWTWWQVAPTGAPTLVLPPSTEWRDELMLPSGAGPSRVRARVPGLDFSRELVPLERGQRVVTTLDIHSRTQTRRVLRDFLQEVAEGLAPSPAELPLMDPASPGAEAPAEGG